MPTLEERCFSKRKRKLQGTCVLNGNFSDYHNLYLFFFHAVWNLSSMINMYNYHTSVYSSYRIKSISIQSHEGSSIKHHTLMVCYGTNITPKLLKWNHNMQITKTFKNKTFMELKLKHQHLWGKALTPFKYHPITL